MKRKFQCAKTGVFLLIVLASVFLFSSLALADAATLSSVNISANGQSKTITFAAPDTTQTVELNQNWGTGSLSVQPMAPGASRITVAGYIVQSGSAVDINADTIEIMVDDVNRYTITIERVNTNLSSVSATVNPVGTAINLTKSGNTYKGSVAETTTAIDISATTESSSATMFCAYGSKSTSGNTSTWSNIDISSLAAGSSSTFVIQVISGGQSSNYEVEITKVSSAELSNAYLSALQVKDGSTTGTELLATFNKDTLTYNMTASNATVYIYPTAASNVAQQVTVNGSTVSGSGYRAVSLNTNGSVTAIPVVITAGDGSTKTYTLNITLSSASLTDCTLSSVVARYSSKNYTATVSSSTYTITVPYGASSVSVTVTPTVSAATYYISTSTATPAASSSYWTSGSTSLNPSSGNNTYYIHVKAQNGSTTARYTLYIKRSTSDSDDAALSALAVRGTTSSTASSGSTYNLMPAFNADTNTYYVAVPNSVMYARITPTAADSNSVITVDGTTVSSGSMASAVSLSTGSSGNSIPIVVTSPSGSYTTTYYVKVYRSSKSSGTTNTAKNLTLRAGTSSSSSKQSVVDFSSDFSDLTTAYTAAVGSSTYAALKWEQDDSNSIAFLITPDGAYKLTDDSYSSSIKLDSGTNTWTVRVFAPNYSTYKDYTIKISRGTTATDAYLKTLTVSLDSGTADWSTSFYKSTTNYTITVPAAATYARITPTLNDSSATIKVNGSTVDNKDTSNKIYFSSTKTIKIVVTAGDGKTTQTYTLTVKQSSKAKYNKVVLRIGNSKAVLDGTTSDIGVTPYLSSSTTMVPIRFISESMGYTVDYNTATKVITISNGVTSFTMTVGKISSGLTVAPIIKGSSTYVPLRYVNDQLGLTTDWNNTSKEITITP